MRPAPDRPTVIHRAKRFDREPKGSNGGYGTEAMRRQGPQKSFQVPKSLKTFLLSAYAPPLDPAPPPRKGKSTEIAAADFGEADNFYFERTER